MNAKRLTDEQATWQARNPKTGEVLFTGSHSGCEAFWRQSGGKQPIIIRRAPEHAAKRRRPAA